MTLDSISFSSNISEKRLSRAKSILGFKIIYKILAFALFLLGGKRSDIASFLNLPIGSINSLTNGLNKYGLPALEDKRSKHSTFLPHQELEIMTDVNTKNVSNLEIRGKETKCTPVIKVNESYVEINLGINEQLVQIPTSNLNQIKSFLLTLLNNGVLTTDQVAKVLEISARQKSRLANKLKQNDIESIIDQRQGQQQDYRFTSEIKAELIQQFVIDLATVGHTSGEQLSVNLENRCQIKLSSRSINHHISKLGLDSIKQTLPTYLWDSKKKSSKS